MSKFKKPSLTLALAVFICISVAAAGTVSAAAIPLPGYKNVNLNIANDVKFPVAGSGVYNFFSAGQSASQGLNALHISSSNNTPYGDITNVTSTGSSTGHFYLSDTGGRGWDDNGILMIAVNGSDENLSNLEIQISSSGYNWTPVPTGSYPAYTASRDGISETFSSSDFDNGYISTWKPCPSSNYAIYDGENVATSSDFKIIFVDLHAGIIGTGTLGQGEWATQNSQGNVTDNGMIRVNYTISGLPAGSMVAFNGYAFCNSSNQGQGIRWTNSVNQDGTRGTGTSGYNVQHF
ncbi:MAG TPA: hypothetical protein VHO92_08795 [Methanobacterium sp.]|nr:hypothetical protein [Methanobacterium sp.]